MYFYTKQQLFEKAKKSDETQALGGYIYNPRNNLFYWASEGKPTKSQMIDELVKDFCKSFQAVTNQEQIDLRIKLDFLDEDDLQLLVSQVQ